MKRYLMFLGNAVILLTVLVLVAAYATLEQKRILATQTEAFENMAVAMESVTTNDLI